MTRLSLNSAATATASRMTSSIPDIRSWAWTVSLAPMSTTTSMARNQTAPTVAASAVLSAWEGATSSSVMALTGSEPATMKMVAETTRDQPLMKPRKGCSARPTQE